MRICYKRLEEIPPVARSGGKPRDMRCGKLDTGNAVDPLPQAVAIAGSGEARLVDALASSIGSQADPGRSLSLRLAHVYLEIGRSVLALCWAEPTCLD